jgi:hypothetical protein
MMSAKLPEHSMEQVESAGARVRSTRRLAEKRTEHKRLRRCIGYW